MKKIFSLLLALICIFTGCKKDRDPLNEGPFDNVMILYSAGFNNLSGSLRADINDLVKGSYLPAASSNDAILILGHHTEGTYSSGSRPCVIRLYSKNGTPVRDTVFRMAHGVNITTVDGLRKGLDFIASKYQAKHYGMVMSSHGTGWVPKGYYDNGGYTRMGVMSADGSAERSAYERIAGENPLTKSFGAEIVYSSGGSVIDELTLDELRLAIPMHLDYLLFDACLMGCIETAYELRKTADYIGFSPAEVLTEGFTYNTMAENLLVHKSPKNVCKEYYEFYANQPASSALGPNATISYIDCSKLDGIASVCNKLFSKYRAELSAVQGSEVQRYFRRAFNASLGRYIEHTWYYDIEDIFIKCGASENDIKELTDAVSSCVIYKGATPSFLINSNGFLIKHYSGLSMYLPCMGDSQLDTFYKGLQWNQATGLVE